MRIISVVPAAARVCNFQETSCSKKGASPIQAVAEKGPKVSSIFVFLEPLLLILLLSINK